MVNTATTRRTGDALDNRASYELADGVRVTGVPAQHGPVGSEGLVGEVTGFVLEGESLPTVYVCQRGTLTSLMVTRRVSAMAVRRHRWGAVVHSYG